MSAIPKGLKGGVSGGESAVFVVKEENGASLGKRRLSTEDGPEPPRFTKEQKKLVALREIFVASIQHVEDCVKLCSASLCMTHNKDELRSSSFSLDTLSLQTAFEEVIARDAALSEYETLTHANSSEMENDREARRDLVSAALKQEALRYNNKLEATQSSHAFDDNKNMYSKKFLQMWSCYTLAE